MAAQVQWSTIASRVLYGAYPDCDLLPIEPPHFGDVEGRSALRGDGEVR